MKSKYFIIALFVLFALSHSANALPARDVMEKMPEQQRTGYLFGLVDMLSYQSILAGNRQQAECIIAAANDSAKLETMFKAFDRYPDKAAEGIVVLLMNRACGS